MRVETFNTNLQDNDNFEEVRDFEAVIEDNLDDTECDVWRNSQTEGEYIEFFPNQENTEAATGD
ncbi:MAG: hypothetical protein ABEJ56_05070 [Candidatus Nanohaloarchaea archaeon]